MRSPFENKWIFIFLLLILLSACTEKETKAEIDEIMTQRLKDQADSIYTSEGYVCPGVIVMIKAPEQKIDMIYTRGVANLTTMTRISPSLQGMIGSNTKTFVVMTLLQLADARLLSLNDYLSEYCPDLPNASHIQLKHLAYMSSGLYDYTESESFRKNYIFSNIGQPITYEQIIAYIVNNGVQFQPGTQFNYCNSNTVILSHIIEQITGNDIKTEIENRFLKPLSLKKTLYPSLPGFPNSNYLHGYEDYLSPGTLHDVSGIYHPSLFGGAGCMISNIYDMERWVKRLAVGAGISPAMIEAREEGVDIFPGIARYKTGFIDILGWYGHKGGLPGYSTLMMHNPSKNCTIIIMESSYEKAIDPLIHLLYIIQTLYPETGNNAKSVELQKSLKALK